MPAPTEPTLRESERCLLDRWIGLLDERLGDDLRAVWLYGSRARGEPPREGSDVDVIALTRYGSPDDERAADDLLEEAAGQVGGDPWSISVRVYDEGWPRRRRAIDAFFMREVDRDKVVLAGEP